MIIVHKNRERSFFNPYLIIYVGKYSYSKQIFDYSKLDFRTIMMVL